MPVEIGIWRLGEKPERVNFSPMQAERQLEEALYADLSIIAPDLMLLGRQIQTDHGGFIDLLAIDSEGGLTVIELKRHKTPREVVAQVLDYASWVQNLTYDDIATLYSKHHQGKPFEQGFAEAFDNNPPEKLNQEHKLVVVASELDPSTERIIGYLADNYDVPLNAIFFRCFKEGQHEYLTRTWLIDPVEAEGKPKKKDGRGAEQTWNGHDFYVSQGEDDQHNWDDCRKYGFVTGGGGKRYTQPFYKLLPGARVFVCIPRRGYVGVGTVTRPAVPFREYRVTVDGVERSLKDVDLVAPNMDHFIDDDEMCEHIVAIDWNRTHSREEAYWEKGMFANQATVCKLRNKFTLERLIQHFGLEE